MSGDKKKTTGLPKLEKGLPKLKSGLPTLVLPSSLKPSREELIAYAKDVWKNMNSEAVFTFIKLGDPIGRGLELQNHFSADGITLKSVYDDDRNICYIVP